MTVRPYTLYAASCDVCGSETEFGWGGSPEDAIANAAHEDGWTRIGDQLACHTSDPAHDQARGGESPDLLRMGPDAMAVTFAVKQVPFASVIDPGQTRRGARREQTGSA